MLISVVILILEVTKKSMACVMVRTINACHAYRLI